MLELVVGVRRRDNVCLPASNTRVFGEFVTLIMLFLTAASVGGGQLCVFTASTTISWSGSSVFTVRCSPGKIIRLDFIDTSEFVCLPSGCVGALLVVAVGPGLDPPTTVGQAPHEAREEDPPTIAGQASCEAREDPPGVLLVEVLCRWCV